MTIGDCLVHVSAAFHNTQFEPLQMGGGAVIVVVVVEVVVVVGAEERFLK
jgi:hypothetical protein